MPNEAKHIFSDSQDISGSANDTLQATNVNSLATGESYKNFQSSNVKYADPSNAGLTRLLIKVMGTVLAAAVDGCVLTMRLYSHTSASTIRSGTLIDSKAVTINTTGTGATAIGTILWDIALPNTVLGAKKYFGIDYLLETQDLTTGAVFAALVDGVEVRSDE